MLLLPECRRRGVRHLHVHFANQGADIALFLERYTAGTPEAISWSLTIHGPAEFSNLARTRTDEKARRAGSVVCISDFVRSQLMGIVEPELWPRLHVVHCGLTVNGNHAAVRAAEDRGPLRVLSVGRLIEGKGHELLIEAVARLARRGVDVEATIVGDGPARERIARRISELHLDGRIALAGAIGQDDLTPYYERADVYCCASFGEGIPVTLMEAMALGVPVVAPRLMGIPELVRDGDTGVLFTPGRDDELARSDFDVRRSAERLHAIFTDLLRDDDRRVAAA
jgi:glycosyltransferase involved in cell wall biosynthesis